MRYILTLMFWLFPMLGLAQDWEDEKLFEGQVGGTTLRVLSSTDTALFAPVIEQYLAKYPNQNVQYLVAVTSDIDAIFRAAPDQFDVVISSAMDLQFKLANDGFALSIDGVGSPGWAQWRHSLFAFTTEPATIVINRAAFAGHSIPASRQELIEALRARPETFRGKLGTYDVRRSGLGYLFATQDARVSETYWRLMEVMGGLGSRLYCCSGEMIDDLVSGEIAVAYNVLGSYALARRDGRDKIEVIQPADFPTIMMRTGFVAIGTDQPDAAVRFMRHLIARPKNGEGTARFPLPSLVGNGEDGPQSIIPLGPALLTYLDRLKRQKFIQAWEDAIIQ